MRPPRAGAPIAGYSKQLQLSMRDARHSIESPVRPVPPIIQEAHSTVECHSWPQVTVEYGSTLVLGR